MSLESGTRHEARDEAARPKPQELAPGRPHFGTASDLDIIRNLNERGSQDLPREFGSLTLLQNGQPLENSTRSPIRPESINNRERQFRIVSDTQGRPVEFTNEQGRWRVKGDGQTFVNTADKDQPRFMRGVPSLDAQGNFTFRNTDYGVTQMHMRDGRTRQQMESAGGTRYAIERNKQGVATGLHDERGSWTSSDGINWKNRNGETQKGRPAMNAHGEYSFTTDNGPKIAHSKELSQAKDLQKEMEKRYNIQISASGTTTDYGPADQPSLRELNAIDNALSRLPKGSLNGLRIDFLGAGKGDEKGFGSYDENRFQLFQNGRVTPEGWMGLEGVAHHELVHHEQMKMGSEFWTGKNPPPEVAAMRRAYGWDYDQKYGSVLLDRFGGRWSPQEDRSDPEHGSQTKWLWVGSGRPPEGQHVRNYQQMADIAKVPMISRYNDHPYESHAEAVGLLRHNPMRLAALSPSAYEATRNWDQQRLDKYLGAGTHIRAADGRIVPNTPENLRLRTEMEAVARNQHMSGHPNSKLFGENERITCSHCARKARK